MYCHRLRTAYIRMDVAAERIQAAYEAGRAATHTSEKPAS
jgi:hypothetical protein